MQEKKITTEYTIWHEPNIYREDREKLNHHKGGILWFTGLSGSGKSTLAHALEHRLYERGVRTYVLDGDNVRQGLNKDLGFSDADRTENIRRIGEVSKLMMDAGLMVLTAFISPFRKDRQIVRQLVNEGDFVEIYCRASLAVCEERDPKGLYKKARSGMIPEFTGINSPYEEPEEPEIILDTGAHGIEDCITRVLDYLQTHDRLGL
jgi:adenylylsulfate kinase